MGDARTGRPFWRRYALCSCKSISTEVSARNNTAAQKNIATPRATLILVFKPARPAKVAAEKPTWGLNGMNTKLRISSQQLTDCSPQFAARACSMQVLRSPSDCSASSSLHFSRWNRRRGKVLENLFDRKGELPTT